MQELQMAGINFKAFDLGGHEIARRVWKDYYAKVRVCSSSAYSDLCSGSMSQEAAHRADRLAGIVSHLPKGMHAESMR